MKTLDYILIGLIILISVSVFFALINYLGGYGAIIATIIIAGLCQWSAEKVSEDNHN